MKVSFVPETASTLDSVRGIGVHSSELITELKKIQIRDNKFQITSDRKSADIVHFTKFRPFFIDISFNKPRGQKWVLTIHDLIPLIYPKHYPPGIFGYVRFLLNRFLIKRNIDQIITISETSKKDICRFLGVKSEIVHVIYLASRGIFKKLKVNKNYNLPKKFALYVGDVNYNKNIPNLVKACKIARIPLVVAGKQAAEIKNLNLVHPETIHLKDLDLSNVNKLGFVSNQKLNDLYNLANVYIQPSLYEGFGLQVLEAVAVGTPLVVTKTQAHVEILGDNVSYVDPKDPDDMALGIGSPNINIKLPRDYSWEKCAKETLNVYETV